MKIYNYLMMRLAYTQVVTAFRSVILEKKMGKLWGNNKEPKKQPVLTQKEKRAVRHAKKNEPDFKPLLSK